MLKSILNLKQAKQLMLVMALASLLLALMLNLSLSIADSMGKELRSYGSNILLSPKGASFKIDLAGEIYQPIKGHLEEKYLHKIKEVFWRNNITAFSPFLDIKVLVNGETVELSGMYFDKNIPVEGEEDYKSGALALNPFWLFEGRAPKDMDSTANCDSSKDFADFSPFGAACSFDEPLLPSLAQDILPEVALSSPLAKRLGINLGDEIVLKHEENSVKALVVGFLENDDKERVLAPLKLAQDLSDLKDLFDYAKISALSIPENDLAQRARRDPGSLDALEFDTWYCTAYVGSIAYQIAEDFPKSSASPIFGVASAQGELTLSIQKLLLIISLIAFTLSSLASASLIDANMQKRSKELGLLKALGAKDWDIFLLFLAQNSLPTILASSLGSAFGMLLSGLISKISFGFYIENEPLIPFLCLFFAIFTLVCACALAIKKSSQKEVLELLREA